MNPLPWLGPTDSYWRPADGPPPVSDADYLAARDALERQGEQPTEDEIEALAAEIAADAWSAR